MRSRLRAEKGRRLTRQEVLGGKLEEHQVGHVTLEDIEAPVQACELHRRRNAGIASLHHCGRRHELGCEVPEEPGATAPGLAVGNVGAEEHRGVLEDGFGLAQGPRRSAWELPRPARDGWDAGVKRGRDGVAPLPPIGDHRGSANADREKAW